MNYFNQQCPVCKEIFKDGDDIVVCPECATPHHRHCWFSNGQCTNSSLHGTDFIWSATEEKSAEPETPTPPSPEKEEENTETEGGRICHICSSENPADAVHCGNCGALFSEEKKDDTESRDANGQMPFNEMFGIDENEQIDGYSAGDYALYVRLNAKRYLHKFTNVSFGKIKFNWAAFLFGPSWFLFRKIYKAGIILLLVFVSITMMTTPLQNQVNDAMEKFRSASQPIAESSQAIENLSDEEYAQLMKNTEEFYASIKKPMLILTGILLVQHLICGLIADRLYFKKVKGDLALIGEAAANNEIRKMMIMQRGGVSFIAFFAGRFGEQLLLNLFVALADKISYLI